MNVWPSPTKMRIITTPPSHLLLCCKFQTSKLPWSWLSFLVFCSHAFVVLGFLNSLVFSTRVNVLVKRGWGTEEAFSWIPNGLLCQKSTELVYFNWLLSYSFMTLKNFWKVTEWSKPKPGKMVFRRPSQTCRCVLHMKNDLLLCDLHVYVGVHAKLLEFMGISPLRSP